MSKKFFISKSLPFFWDNVEKYCRARQATGVNITRRVRFTRLINEATKTLSEYMTPIAFPLQQ